VWVAGEALIARAPFDGFPWGRVAFGQPAGVFLPVAAGRYPRPELVIWPENSSDIDPLRNPDARAVIDRAARAIRAPILVGAVLQGSGGRPTNTAIVWDPWTGPGEEHDKRRLQPFGEYMPYREFFRLFNPYVDRASNFVAGAGDGAVDLGPARVGVATCYEVVFDDLVRDSVRSGAQLLAVPTNNATFGFTEMTYQQQAISRVRAVEHGRVVLVAATSGVSAVIAPDGTVEQHTTLFTPAALVAEVPLRSGTTLATRLGSGPEWSLASLGGLGMVAAAMRAIRFHQKSRRNPGEPAVRRAGEGGRR
jgi:apolipoprotein N-acyltransferase